MQWKNWNPRKACRPVKPQINQINTEANTSFARLTCRWLSNQVGSVFHCLVTAVTGSDATRACIMN